jgi:transcriptional regulator with XRE-family HTH domain
MVMNIDVKTIGDKVRVSRAARNWSQGVVALIAHVSQITVSRLERNVQVDEKDKQKILAALDIAEQ